MRTLLPWEPVEGTGLEPRALCSPVLGQRVHPGAGGGEGVGDSGQKGEVALAQEAPRSWAQGKGGHAEATLGRGPEDLGEEARSDLRERWPGIFQPSPKRAAVCT